MDTRKFIYSLFMLLLPAALLWGAGQAGAACPPGYVLPPQLVPGVDYCLPNYANSPVLTKFKDPLPGVMSSGAAITGFYFNNAAATGTAANIPVAVPTVWTNGVDDYYEIALVEYTQKMHSDLPATKLHGYVQIYPPGTTPGVGAVALTLADGVTPLTYGGSQVYGYTAPTYMGPIITATQGKPSRIKFYNLLPAGSKHIIPLDTTVMGAGMGPDGSMYPETRSTVHLHGGDSPWISDGTTHQWITPAGEPGTLLKGASAQNVPDMPVPAGGAATYYFTNGQSGRLMFYHEHAYGITRLGVYAGIAAGYLLTDATERALSANFAPGGEIPLVIQDRAFVSDGSVPANAAPLPVWPVGAIAPAATTVTDPTWALNTNWGQTKGSLWFPHVYMPNQNPNDLSGASMFGRWDYGPWFWPVFPVTGPLPNTGTAPLPTIVPEAFVDTPIINGTAYPTLSVSPTTYRFRILNACNDRYLNLQLYVPSNIVSGFTGLPSGSGYTAPPAVTIAPAAGDTTGFGASAVATIDTTVGSPTFGMITGLTLTSVGSGYTLAPVVTIAAPTTIGGATATAAATLYTGLTEVGMVPADKQMPPPGGWPAWWTANDTPGMTPNILDGRQGGVPDPRRIGPDFIHIGSEGGVSPLAVDMLNTPIGYEQNKRSVTVLNTYEHTLFLGPAERADVMVDFSQALATCTALGVTPCTLIMYNDAPAPLPAGDPRNDYYTGDPDNTFQGGAPVTQAGFGPNTRTMMQIVVSGTAGTALNVPTLSAAVSAAFANTQAKPVVPETLYTAAEGAPPSGADVYARISDTSLTFSPYLGAPEYTGTAVTAPMLPKTIQELFDPLGRMNATLGVEIPFTTATIQTTIPYGFADPATEVIPAGATQIWKITHNGVDTHAIHFHLFNVQVINRVGWDGMIKPPWPEELGWKETVKMNPLEDIVVALRAKVPVFPFQQPNNMRYLDPTMAPNAPLTIIADPYNNPVTGVTNQIANFGNEYTWHCHLLGHEENDMMRPLMVATSPLPPTNLSYVVSKGSAVLKWQDNSPDETAYMVQKKTGTGVWTTLATVPAGTLTYTDTTYKNNQGTVYQVIAVNTVGSGVANFPSYTAYSLPSNQAAAPLGATVITSVTQALAVGSPVVVKWTYSAADQTGFTIQRSTSITFGNGTATFTVAGNVLTFSDTGVVVGLKKSTTYYYRVIPTNANGSGAPSNTASLLVHP